MANRTHESHRWRQRIRRVLGWLRTHWWSVLLFGLLITLFTAGFISRYLPPRTAETLSDVAALAGISLVGGLGGLAVWNLLATRALDFRRVPPPGELVAIRTTDTYFKLHILASGDTSSGPTVVLLGDVGGTVLDWSRVQSQLAEPGPVVAVDRAGYGWSHSGPRSRSVRQNVRELHDVLLAADLPRPYVLVGEGYGALVARLFAAQHPRHSGGLVLLDPLHEQQYEVIPALRHDLYAHKQALSFMELFARLGWLRLVQRWLRIPATLPPEQHRAARMHSARVASYSTAYDELDVLEHSFGQMDIMPRQRGIPVAVLSRALDTCGSGQSQQTAARLQQLHAELSWDSPLGEHVVAHCNDPLSPLALDQPRMVLDVIGDMVAQARRHPLA